MSRLVIWLPASQRSAVSRRCGSGPRLNAVGRVVSDHSTRASRTLAASASCGEPSARVAGVAAALPSSGTSEKRSQDSCVCAAGIARRCGAHQLPVPPRPSSLRSSSRNKPAARRCVRRRPHQGFRNVSSTLTGRFDVSTRPIGHLVEHAKHQQQAVALFGQLRAPCAHRTVIFPSDRYRPSTCPTSTPSRAPRLRITTE